MSLDRSMMSMLKSSRGWDSMRNVTIDGTPAVRHRLVLRPVHMGMRLSSSLGTVGKADIGRELLVDVYEDGNIIDVIGSAPQARRQSVAKDRKIPTGRRQRTGLDMILDRVRAGQEEVTIDTDGYTEEQVDRILAAAKARGFHAAYDGRFVLVRDLRERKGAREAGSKLFSVRHVSRVVNGSQRDVDIYTFTGHEEDYDKFLDLRTDLEGTLRRGKAAPTVRIDGRSEYASFDVVLPR